MFFLTIDCKIQSIVEDELENACSKWKPDSAVAIAMDPNTGEVLAMANYPSFNPNTIHSLNAKVEEELEKACKQWDPNSAIAIAMANYSSFNPNTIHDLNAKKIRKIAKEIISEHTRNRAITDCFEPGLID